MFDEVLITNRGIVAVRVIDTLKKMGIKSVAVYTPDDADSAHVRKADARYCIRDYREFAELLQVAVHLREHEGYEIGVHPGYGFLSEDVDFAEICDEQFVFIGPPFKVVELMGNKIAAIGCAKEAGLQVIPGSGVINTEKQAQEAAKELDFPNKPVIIKAAGGGGGMGLKPVHGETLDDLVGAFREVSNYAKLNFTTPDVYIERLIENPKHIEVQILADMHGNIVSLGERDCSIQRRHQKLIEFSPADISGELRRQMEDAAIRLAKSVGYINAGTVEFLVDGEDFYFMEVNTRLQVEHRVTELRYGIDIVEQQLNIARGEPLKLGVLEPKGFAVECRINAEDPKNDFEPSMGKVRRFKKPDMENVVVDSHLMRGYYIPHRYDSLIANVVAYGDTKEQAINTMYKALRDIKIKGDNIKTTVKYHIRKIWDV